MSGEEYDTHVSFTIGLDLGQSRDYSAISVIETRARVVNSDYSGDSRTPYFLLRHIQRIPLGTPYDQIVEIAGAMVSHLTGNGRPPALICDATGVGKPVIDLMRRGGLKPVGVTITGGKEEQSVGDFAYSIPKRNLVSALIIAFQTGTLKMAAELPAIELLRTELVNFKAKITTSGHETFEAWRESIHDDLVLSTALAVWWADRNSRRPKVMFFNLFDRESRPRYVF